MVAVPRERVEETTESVRRLTRLHMRPTEISQQLGLNLKTTYKFLSRIRQENSETLRSMRAESFTNHILLSIERFEEQIRQLQMIRDNARSDFAKIEATNSIVDVEMLIVNLKGYIPKILEEEAVAKRTAEALELDSHQRTPRRYQKLKRCTSDLSDDQAVRPA